MISSFRPVRALFGGAAVIVLSFPALAQQQPPPQRPTPEQARAMLQASPDLVARMRQQLLGSGMSREQIKARLRAQGYPDDMLDAYLPGGSGDAAPPSDEVFSALRELGIADSTDIALMRRLQADTSSRFRDSLARLQDSLPPDSSAILRRLRMRADVADSLARLDSGFNIFGLEAFRSAGNRFDPMLAGPVDANYRLGPGDRLVLVLSGDVEAAYSLDVTREGFVVIPQVGRVDVANLTLGQLDDVLFARLGRVYSGVRRGSGATTHFSVSVSRLRANQIFVLGDVERAGSYMVSSAGTAVTAIYAAGGPTVNGGVRAIQIRRGSQVVGSLDLYDYLLRGDASHDVRLQTGDVVFVPSRGPRIRVIGEVVRPATYEIKPGETLLDAIRTAGGFRAEASRRRVQIERVLPPSQRTADGRERVTVDVEPGTVGDAQLARMPIEGGDVVRVFPVAERLRNTIRVIGNVNTPGSQGLEPGMTIADAIRKAGGPKPDVFLGRVLVTRMRADSSLTQMRAALRDSLGAVVGDFALQEDDVVELFSLTEFRPERFVAIGGAVKQGGRFPYRRGMTMRDLILLGGGLEESAYLDSAEIARLPAERAGATTARTLRVALDSTYLFERRPDLPYDGPPGLPARATGAGEVELRPYDNVLILHQPGWELQRVVKLTGEVRFPGDYALRSRSERLADLIARAGGLTSEAYAAGTEFIRARDDAGRVAIDVPQALRQPRSPENLILMHGDRINVPAHSFTVSVRGFVNAPNLVAYVPGRTLDYYVAQGGGPNLRGGDDQAYVTQPSGKRETVKRRRLLPDRIPKPMAGSVVVVPEKALEEKQNIVAVVGAVASALASVVSLVILIQQLPP